jgi:predicted ATPase
LDGESVQEVAYRDTEHYRVTRDFLNAPERYFKHLFGEETGGEDDA